MLQFVMSQQNEFVYIIKRSANKNRLMPLNSLIAKNMTYRHDHHWQTAFLSQYTGIITF